MNKRKLRVVLLAAGLLVLSAVFVLRVKVDMVDFEVGYRAGIRIRAGETLYRIEDGHYQFKYPPFSALLYLPLSFLPLDAAKAAWFFLIIFSIIFILKLSRKIINDKSNNFSLLLLLLSFLILARYFLRELQLGQINSVITMILITMIWLMTDTENHSFSPGKEWLAGLLWGLATALKPYSLIFLPYFILKKKWKVLGSGALFLAFSFMIPSLFYGIRGNISIHNEWRSSLSASTPLLLDSQDNISILGLSMKWTGSLNTSLMILAFSLIILAILLLVIIKKGSGIYKPIPLESSIILLLIPLISPLGWDYTLLSSILGVMIIIRYYSRYPKYLKILLVVNFAVISLSLYDILGRSLYSQFMSLSVITLNFLLLVFYLSYLRFKKYA